MVYSSFPVNHSATEPTVGMFEVINVEECVNLLCAAVLCISSVRLGLIGRCIIGEPGAGWWVGINHFPYSHALKQKTRICFF